MYTGNLYFKKDGDTMRSMFDQKEDAELELLLETLVSLQKQGALVSENKVHRNFIEKIKFFFTDTGGIPEGSEIFYCGM